MLTPRTPTRPAAPGDAVARFAFVALLAASVAILGAAFAFQWLGGLQPCVLCIWQRYPYAVVVGLAGLGAGLARAGAARPILALLLVACAAALLVNAGIAAFHVGVEQRWWEGTPGCVGQTAGAATVEELRRRLLEAPVVRCDEVAWSLFGISMAGYNFLLSLALAGASLRAARLVSRRMP